MHELLTLTLEAHHVERNHHRRYQITIGRDLLNDWVVVTRYGRIGQRGQEHCFAGPAADELQAVVRERLRRRLSAPKRIGCAYRVSELITAVEIDSEEWLPSELLKRLRSA
jgi:predicted DNA-binding WGR domain protein